MPAARLGAVDGGSEQFLDAGFEQLGFLLDDADARRLARQQERGQNDLAVIARESIAAVDQFLHRDCTVR